MIVFLVIILLGGGVWLITLSLPVWDVEDPLPPATVQIHFVVKPVRSDILIIIHFAARIAATLPAKSEITRCRVVP